MKRYINIVKDVFKMFPGKKLVVASLFISSALGSLFSLLPPIATSGIIKVLTEQNFNGIWFYVVLYLVFYAIYFMAINWNYSTYSKLGKYYPIEGKRKIIEHVANNEDIFLKVSKGRIINTCSDDVDYIVDVVDSASEITIRILQLVVIFFIFTHYNVFVAIIALLVDFAYIKIMNDNAKCASKHYEGTKKNNDKIMDIVNQMLLNIKQVKTLNMLPNLEKRIDKNIINWEGEYQKRRFYITERYSKIPIITYLGKIFLYIFLGYLVTINKMTIDVLILLISYFELTMTNTDKLLEYLLNLNNYSIRVNRIKTILNVKGSSINDFGDLENDYITGLVEFKNVYFKNKNKTILDNVSFKLYPGEINAIVGASGSGKTSIINLLYRLTKVSKGNIYIDNENIYDYSNRVYSSNVSGVYQKPFVFDMSIKDNLGLINPNVSDQIDACKLVGIHNMIINLPNGYNTKIDEDDEIFNDNTKQLLMIARAIISKAEILLFDEVTSNMDEKTTKKIQSIMQELKQDKTIIMVTHKPEMMKIADRVVVLDKGRVIASGKNSEVGKKCELYKELKKKDFVSASDWD